MLTPAIERYSASTAEPQGSSRHVPPSSPKTRSGEHRHRGGCSGRRPPARAPGGGRGTDQPFVALADQRLVGLRSGFRGQETAPPPWLRDVLQAGGSLGGGGRPSPPAP